MQEQQSEPLNTKELWDRTLAEIESSVSYANFATWFKNTHVIKEDGGVVYVGVPNDFVKDWLKDRFHKTILKILRSHSEHIRAIEYVNAPGENSSHRNRTGFGKEHQKSPQANELPLKDLYVTKEDNLNTKYLFENFVVCPFNELAFAAAQGVIKNPGLSYNPLFIYGPIGLGKTHLIQAIGNQIKKERSDKKVYYVTSEKFFVDYINSVQVQKTNIFKEKYRKYDVLIVDDIQFLSNKISTQEEFFHLFNTFYDNNKQLIISSDKHYNFIPNLEDRLRSRFGAGMIAGLAEPNLEARVAILHSKMGQFNISLEEEIVTIIAGTIRGSIRELEGALNSIACQLQLKNRELNQAEVRAILRKSEKPKKNVSLEDLVRIVSEYYQIDKDVIYQKTRKKEVVKPRQVIMYLLREEFNISFPTIGQQLGGRDHTTVIHSYEKIKRDIKEDMVLVQEIEQLRSMF